MVRRKTAKIQSKTEGLSKADAEERAKALEAEKVVNEARIAAAAPVVEEVAEEIVEVAPEVTTEPVAEETATEEVVAEASPEAEETEAPKTEE